MSTAVLSYTNIVSLPKETLIRSRSKPEGGSRVAEVRAFHQSLDEYRATGAHLSLTHFLIPLAESARARSFPSDRSHLAYVSRISISLAEKIILRDGWSGFWFNLPPPGQNFRWHHSANSLDFAAFEDRGPWVSETLADQNRVMKRADGRRCRPEFPRMRPNRYRC